MRHRPVQTGAGPPIVVTSSSTDLPPTGERCADGGVTRTTLLAWPRPGFRPVAVRHRRTVAGMISEKLPRLAHFPHPRSASRSSSRNAPPKREQRNNSFNYIFVNGIFCEQNGRGLGTTGAAASGVSRVTAAAIKIGQLCANRLAPYRTSAMLLITQVGCGIEELS